MLTIFFSYLTSPFPLFSHTTFDSYAHASDIILCDFVLIYFRASSVLDTYLPNTKTLILLPKLNTRMYIMLNGRPREPTGLKYFKNNR